MKVKETILTCGHTDSDEKGWYIDPTVLVTTDPAAPTIKNELFGPVLTVYVYPADQYEETVGLANEP